jgi:hypothetical protein
MFVKIKINLQDKTAEQRYVQRRKVSKKFHFRCSCGLKMCFIFRKLRPKYDKVKQILHCHIALNAGAGFAEI